jgi:hypothetical protein
MEDKRPKSKSDIPPIQARIKAISPYPFNPRPSFIILMVINPTKTDKIR